MTVGIHPAEHDQAARGRQPIERRALWWAIALHIGGVVARPSGILLALAIAAASLTACASDVSKTLGATVTVAPARPQPWPSPIVAAPDATPTIQRVWVTTLHLTAGGGFEGAVVTSTNVASVEIRTAVFSINAPRSAYGRFAFKLHILEFPPLLKHTYPMQIIARNAAGVEAIENAYLVLE